MKLPSCVRWQHAGLVSQGYPAQATTPPYSHNVTGSRFFPPSAPCCQFRLQEGESGLHRRGPDVVALAREPQCLAPTGVRTLDGDEHRAHGVALLPVRPGHAGRCDRPVAREHDPGRLAMASTHSVEITPKASTRAASTPRTLVFTSLAYAARPPRSTAEAPGTEANVAAISPHVKDSAVATDCCRRRRSLRQLAADSVMRWSRLPAPGVAASPRLARTRARSPR